jgi:hypothetical protein
VGFRPRRARLFAGIQVRIVPDPPFVGALRLTGLTPPGSILLLAPPLDKLAPYKAPAFDFDECRMGQGLLR